LGLSPRQVGFFVADLVKSQQIVRYGYDGNVLTWRALGTPSPRGPLAEALVTPSPRGPLAEALVTPSPRGPLAEAKGEQVGIDEEHWRWHAYWSLPRAERQRRAMAAP